MELMAGDTSRQGRGRPAPTGVILHRYSVREGIAHPSAPHTTFLGQSTNLVSLFVVDLVYDLKRRDSREITLIPGDQYTIVS